MPIDPSIILGIRPPDPGPSLLDTYEQITRLQERKAAGEERRAAAQEAQAKRQREAQIEAAMRDAITLDPVTQQPTIDYAKLLPHVPPSTLFEVKQHVDATAEQALRLRETNLSVEQKIAAYLGGVSRGVRAANYDPKAYSLAVVGARRVGALTQAQADQLLDEAEADPTTIQRHVDAAIAQAGGAEPRLAQIQTMEGGVAGTKFVPETPGAFYPAVPKEPTAAAVGSFEDYLTRKAKEVGRPVVALTPRQVAQAKAEFEAAGRAPRDERVVQVIGPGGQPIWVRESQAVGQAAGSAAAGGGKPSTGAHKRALNFFNRAQQADTDLQAIEQEIAGLGLLGQTQLQYAPNLAQSQTGQLYTQAQRAFTEARLRKDSGAAIPPHEFENDRRTYFAQPGDTQATLQQKARARAAVLASIAFEAGPALGEFFGEDAEGLLTGLKTRAAPPSRSAAPEPTDDRTTTTGPRPGEQRPIPNVPGGVAEYRGGKWIRVK